MTSQHKEGKRQRRGGRSSMVSRLVCKSTEDAVMKPRSEQAAEVPRNRIVCGNEKNEGDIVEKNKMYLDVRELEKSLRRVGLQEERKRKLQGSPESLAGVPSPVPLRDVSSKLIVTHGASPSNTSIVGVEDSSIRSSDDRSSFSWMSSSVSSCKLSTPQLATEGHAACESKSPYDMSDYAARSCSLRGLNSGFSTRSNPVGQAAISETLGDLRASRVNDLNVHRSSQQHRTEKASHENVDRLSLKKKSTRKKHQAPVTPLPTSQSQYRERPLVIQENDDAMQVKQPEERDSSPGRSLDHLEISLRGGDVPQTQETEESSASGDAKIQLLRHYPRKVSSSEQSTSSSNLSKQSDEINDQLLVANEGEDDDKLGSPFGLKRRSRRSVARLHHQPEEELIKRVQSGQSACELQVPKSVSAIAELVRRSKATDDHSPPATSSPEIHEVFNSIAMVKSSYNPQRDFKESMMEMVLAKRLGSSEGLEQLLQCYLSLNPQQYHHIIVEAFQTVCADLFRITT